MPLASRSALAVGEISGGDAYRDDLGPGLVHTRPVRWLRRSLPREALGHELNAGLEGFTPFAAPAIDGGEETPRRLASDPTIPDAEPPAPVPPRPQRPSRVRDPEKEAREQILEAMTRKFRGRELTRLVQAVLQASGFTMGRARTGPSGETSFPAA